MQEYTLKFWDKNLIKVTNIKEDDFAEVFDLLINTFEAKESITSKDKIKKLLREQLFI